MLPSGVTLSVLAVHRLDDLALTLFFQLRTAVGNDGVPHTRQKLQHHSHAYLCQFDQIRHHRWSDYPASFDPAIPPQARDGDIPTTMAKWYVSAQRWSQAQGMSNLEQVDWVSAPSLSQGASMATQPSLSLISKLFWGRHCCRSSEIVPPLVPFLKITPGRQQSTATRATII